MCAHPTIMRYRTDAVPAVLAWMEADKEQRTRTAIAKRLGVAHSTVSRWLKGLSRPDPAQRDAMHALAGVDPSLWQTPKERRLAEKLRTAFPARAAS